MMKFHLPTSCLFCMTLTSLVSATQGESITQTVTFPTQIFAEGATPIVQTQTFTGTFNQFDPSLGVLDSASFVLDFDFDVTILSGGGGGSVSGEVFLKELDGELFIGGGFGFGGGPQLYEVDQYYDTTGFDEVINGNLDEFIGTGSIDLVAQIEGNSSAPGMNVRFELVDDLGAPSMTLVYDYTPAELEGDYNGDGAVNIADYAVWRNNLGSSATLPGDTTPGEVTLADYDAWKSNFGASLATLSIAAPTTVPEPSTIALVVLGATVAVAGRWVRG